MQLPKQNIKRFSRLFIVAALIISAGRGFISVEASDSVTDLSSEAKKIISDKQDQLDAIDAKIKAYKQIINLKQRQGSVLTDQIQSLEAQANKLQTEIDANQQKLNELENGIQSLSARITEKEVAINGQKRILSELLRIFYSDFATANIVPVIFSSDETAAYFKQADATTEVGDKVRELLDSMKTLRESLLTERTDLSAKEQAAAALHQQLNEQNQYLESTKTSKASLLAKTQAEANKYDNLVDDLQKQRDDIELEIQNLESDKLGSINLKNMPSFKHGLLDYPLKSTKTVSQGYGKTGFSKKSSFYGSSHFHNGFDYAAATGTPIYAALSGKVVGIGNEGKYAYGKWIAIDHNNGIITLYGHMSSQLVHMGDKVDTGDKIGLVGATGYATGPHVHFSVFSAESFELVHSSVVKNLMIPIGATVTPSVYLP